MRRTTPFELTLEERPRYVGLSRWLHEQLRQAILSGRLPAGVRLPASRDFALQYGLSRGTVVGVFEQLEAEGFLRGRRGFGTWVNQLPESSHRTKKFEPTVVKLPSPLTGLSFPQPAPAFRSHEPALDEFPMAEWSRLTSRCLRRASTSLLAQRDARGHPQLRKALAEYLGVSRGVNCNADQIVIVTGIQQALDILARVLLKARDSVWMEDPGYFGAVTAFRNAGAKIVPVPVDNEGLSVSAGKELGPRAKGVYLTPAHQFPLGVMMTLNRRLEILAWAQSRGAFVIEDDYDGIYRLAGRPIPTLQSMDKNESVILIGSFNKILFPALRIGYMVLPQRLADAVVPFRFGLDQNTVGLEQSVLAEFIERGHLGRHIRRTRDLYSERLAIFRSLSKRHLEGLMEISNTQAGLYTVGLLENGMTSREAEEAALKSGVETMALDRFRLRRKTPHGLLLGFAPFDRRAMEVGIRKLATALSGRR